MKRIWLIGTVAAALMLAAACDNSVEGPEAEVFEVEVAGERFFIALTGSAQIARAKELLNSGAPNNVHGELVRGDGGFNAPYSWHLNPATVTFPDLTMEICDGRPGSDVESDVDYWLETVRYYCPWGAQIVGTR